MKRKRLPCGCLARALAALCAESQTVYFGPCTDQTSLSTTEAPGLTVVYSLIIFPQANVTHFELPASCVQDVTPTGDLGLEVIPMSEHGPLDFGARDSEKDS